MKIISSCKKIFKNILLELILVIFFYLWISNILIFINKSLKLYFYELVLST